MANPKLSQPSRKFLTVSDGAKRLFQVIYREQNKKGISEDIPRIKVSDLISKMAFYYEKIRNSVDYKEEHLLRKNAIERILKRHIIFEGVIPLKELNSHHISKSLLIELIRAGYLPNNKIPETKIGEIEVTVLKYLKLKKCCLDAGNGGFIGEGTDFAQWIISIMASDIEEQLGRSEVDRVTIEYMYQVLLDNIILPEESPFAADKEIQIYIGIHTNFLKFDREMISFILFKYYNADWKDATDAQIMEVAQNIEPLRIAITNQLDHPLTGQLNRIIGRYTLFFSILRDVVEDDPVAVYDSFKKDPKSFPRQIKKMCNHRYDKARSKLWRAAVRSIIYIFITKSIFVLLLEIPAIKFFGQELNMTSLIINISFPAILLFLIVLFTKMPGEANSEKIVDGISELVFVELEKKAVYKLREPVRRGGFLQAIFGIIYSVTFLMSFGLVVWGLDKINFNWVSIIIFLFFLAFISFFSVRIRKNAKDLLILEPKESVLGLLTDFFYMPVIAVGKYLSEKFARINIFVFILDFIIEAPFKVVVEIAEEWTKYVKERKDEIV